MKEIIASIKDKLEIIEDAHNNLSGEQQKGLKANLNKVDRDLRGIILMTLAISKR